MAGVVGLNLGNTLPRFLLPKISWQAAPSSTLQFRAFTSAISNNNCTSTHIQPSLRRPNTRTDGRIRMQTQCPTTVLQRRAFSVTQRRARDHHFDTLKFVQRLQEEGFTEAQSVAMMKVLSDVIEERYVGQSHP
jgi:hypothetical protein